MAMKRCPICGEKYSDTYRHCPFCEEEELARSGDRSRRRQGGHRVARKGPSLLSPVLIVAILVMAAVLVYLLFGDAIAQRFGRDKTTDPVNSGDVSAPVISDGASGSASSSGASSSGSAPETAVALIQEDFTLKAGETHALTVSDGSGDYTWESDDDGIASVSGSGVVTAISAGTAAVTVSDGYTSDSCIVRVTGTAAAGGGSASLSAADVSIKVGESFTLSVSGTAASAVYDVDSNDIASVTETGRVTGKALGRANVTVTVGGQTLKCIVRVVR